MRNSKHNAEKVVNLIVREENEESSEDVTMIDVDENKESKNTEKTSARKQRYTTQMIQKSKMLHNRLQIYSKTLMNSCQTVWM